MNANKSGKTDSQLGASALSPQTNLATARVRKSSSMLSLSRRVKKNEDISKSQRKQPVNLESLTKQYLVNDEIDKVFMPKKLVYKARSNCSPTSIQAARRSFASVNSG